MPFIECKATDNKGQAFPSKAAMKRALAADPSRVILNSVPSLGGSFYGSATDFLLAGLAGTKLTIVGPDPQTSRKWYGTIEVKNGQLKAS